MIKLSSPACLTHLLRMSVLWPEYSVFSLFSSRVQRWSLSLALLVELLQARAVTLPVESAISRHPPRLLMTCLVLESYLHLLPLLIMKQSRKRCVRLRCDNKTGNRVIFLRIIIARGVIQIDSAINEIARGIVLGIGTHTVSTAGMIRARRTCKADFEPFVAG